jgi:hypothetical protein
MLLQNYKQNTNAGRNFGESNPYNYYKLGTCMQFYTGWHVVPDETEKDSFPTGTNPPYSYILGLKGALLSSTTLINGTSDLTGGMAMGINIEANLAGSSTVAANLSLIVQLATTLSGTGVLTGSMVGIVQLASDLAGSGDLQGALNLLVSMTANLSGTGTISGALLTGIAHMEAEISPFTDLSPESLASSIMNYMVEGNYTFEQCIRLLTAVAAGKTTVVDLGGGLATVTFRDINDTQDRVEADMTNSERTNVTLDLDDVI